MEGCREGGCERCREGVKGCGWGGRVWKGMGREGVKGCGEEEYGRVWVGRDDMEGYGEGGCERLWGGGRLHISTYLGTPPVQIGLPLSLSAVH